MSTFKSLLLVLIGFFAGVGIFSLIQAAPLHAQNAAPNLTVLTARLKADEKTLAALKAKTAPITVSGTDLTITGVNVHILDGSGSTDDATLDPRTNGSLPGKTLTGLGNLIIGYNEKGSDHNDLRIGSHNLILGDKNNYSSYGGFVTSFDNAISARYATVSGGYRNTASGGLSSIGGGDTNMAGGVCASVSGGGYNNAGKDDASVSGGRFNKAIGEASTVSGGLDNTASGEFASVGGGSSNMASGGAASVSGGSRNSAAAEEASVGGGKEQTAAKEYGWAGSSSSP